MKQNFPFSPFPERFLDSWSKAFLNLSDDIMPLFPDLQETMRQAEMETEPHAYVSCAVLVSFFYLAIFSVLFIAGGFLFKQISIINFIVPPIVFFFIFISIIYFPKVKITRRMKQIDANLIPALRHLLIEVKSGVTLFEAMHGISSGYGEVSKVFARAVNDIATGKKETDVLAELSELNPSFAFRRAVWQLSNALRAGSDISTALESIIHDLTQEQITSIRKYGQELNPWTMIYMVAAVIFPSLGITFLVIITSFTGMKIPDIIFPLILFVLLGFQVFFMSFVKNKRPAI